METRGKPLDVLAQCIAEGRRLAIITGAGLSAASGLPLFRGENASIWSVKAQTWGTKAAFLKDPVHWYNSFWFPMFRSSFTRAIPNAGHEAIAAVATMSQNLLVITQNIDTLHQQTRTAWAHAQQLVEVHGRLGLYHCSSEDPCEFATEKWHTATEIFPPDLARLIEEVDDADVVLESAPVCWVCGSPMMPLALMFDECYTSHAFYKFDKVMDWIESCDVVIFVGTSFSVQITSLALQEAKRRKLAVFNLNPKDRISGKDLYGTLYNIMGPAEETLTTLVQLITAKLQETKQVTLAGALVGRPADQRKRLPAKPDVKSTLLKDEEVNTKAVDPPEIFQATTIISPADQDYDLDPVVSHPLLRSDVHVELSADFARKQHPDPTVESAIDQLWSDLLVRTTRVFNGSKFRMAGWRVSSEGTGAVDVGGDPRAQGEEAETSNKRRRRATAGRPQQTLVLQMWLTDYKTFRGTNCSPDVAELVHDGVRDHANADAYLSQKLGVGAAVCTTDGRVVLIRRSTHVAEAQGMLDVPGGHAEPSNLGIEAVCEKPPATVTVSSEAVVNEIFDSAISEVVDETNIPRDRLLEPRLLGIVRQRNTAGCPGALFTVDCRCSSTEVEALYKQGPPEVWESTEIVFVTLEDAFAGRFPGPVTPSARGCFRLLSMWKQTQSSRARPASASAPYAKEPAEI